MNAPQMRESALNLRKRAELLDADQVDRKASWLAEAEQLEKAAGELEKKAPAKK